MFALKFRGEGFEVIPAYGAVDAIEKLRGGISPDAVVIDIVAPIMDSLELLAVIRAEKLVSSAKIIVLGEVQEAMVAEKARMLAADGYMVKAAATPSQVVERVMEVLHMKGPENINN